MVDTQMVASGLKNMSLPARIGAGVVGVVLLAVALPLIYWAFLASLGLIGLAVTGVIGVTMIKVLPMLGQRLENKLLGLRKAEARKNPIEQLQNNLLRKSGQLHEFKKGMETIGGQIGSLDTALKEQTRRDPDDDLSDQYTALSKMKEYYEAKKSHYMVAHRALDDYKKAIERAKFKFGFGTTAQGIAQAMNANDAESLMNNMLSDESFKSVDMQFNSAFAALDMDAIELSGTSRLEFGRGISLDATEIVIPTFNQSKQERSQQ